MTLFAPIEANLRECFRALAERRSGGETRHQGGVEILSLGVTFQMFNAAFFTTPVEDEADLERRVVSAAVMFGARGLEWSLWMCDGLLPEGLLRRAGRVLGRYGLRLASQMPGMMAERLYAPLRELPRCEVRSGATGKALEDFRAIGSSCFRVPPEWFAEVFDSATGRRGPFQAWVGYVAGMAVATAATVRDAEAIGIYNVATIPGYRQRGYGEAMVRECVAREESVGGELPIVLQSTAAGIRLYERMGFQSVTNFRVWVS